MLLNYFSFRVKGKGGNHRPTILSKKHVNTKYCQSQLVNILVPTRSHLPSKPILKYFISFDTILKSLETTDKLQQLPHCITGVNHQKIKLNRLDGALYWVDPTFINWNGLRWRKQNDSVINKGSFGIESFVNLIYNFENWDLYINSMDFEKNLFSITQETCEVYQFWFLPIHHVC